MSKKILAAALSMTVLLSLSGCNSDEKQNASKHIGDVKTEDEHMAAVADGTDNAHLPETAKTSGTESTKTDIENINTETDAFDNVNADDFTYTENENGEIIILHIRAKKKR
ncbi:MAG: hypothetical protein NC203_10180 [Firmicutes bacterium]|nr:hypothetical protein [Bacillota bacterium]